MRELEDVRNTGVLLANLGVAYRLTGCFDESADSYGHPGWYGERTRKFGVRLAIGSGHRSIMSLQVFGVLVLARGNLRELAQSGLAAPPEIQENLWLYDPDA